MQPGLPVLAQWICTAPIAAFHVLDCSDFASLCKLDAEGGSWIRGVSVSICVRTEAVIRLKYNHVRKYFLHRALGWLYGLIHMD